MQFFSSRNARLSKHLTEILYRIASHKNINDPRVNALDRMCQEAKNRSTNHPCKQPLRQCLTFFTSDPKRRNGKTLATQREKSYNYLILLKLNEGLRRLTFKLYACSATFKRADHPTVMTYRKKLTVSVNRYVNVLVLNLFLLTKISRPTGKVVATHRLRSTALRVHLHDANVVSDLSSGCSVTLLHY